MPARGPEEAARAGTAAARVSAMPALSTTEATEKWILTDITVPPGATRAKLAHRRARRFPRERALMSHRTAQVRESRHTLGENPVARVDPPGGIAGNGRAPA